ncbi:MAG TPA: hypothetical protein VG710_16390 [Opitutus sp.]|nr:hypothetical protein [Opitutus sp.]
MKSRINGLRVASAVFGLMFLGQFVRLAARLKVAVNGRDVPLWAGGIALVVTGGLSWWLGRLSLEPKPATPPQG